MTSSAIHRRSFACQCTKTMTQIAVCHIVAMLYTRTFDQVIIEEELFHQRLGEMGFLLDCSTLLK